MLAVASANSSLIVTPPSCSQRKLALPWDPQLLVDARLEVRLLGGELPVSGREVEAHLPSEHRQRAGAIRSTRPPREPFWKLSMYCCSKGSADMGTPFRRRAPARTSTEKERVKSAKNETCRVGSCFECAVAGAISRVDGLEAMGNVTCGVILRAENRTPQ